MKYADDEKYVDHFARELYEAVIGMPANPASWESEHCRYLRARYRHRALGILRMLDNMPKWIEGEPPAGHVDGEIILVQETNGDTSVLEWNCVVSAWETTLGGREAKVARWRPI